MTVNQPGVSGQCARRAGARSRSRKCLRLLAPDCRRDVPDRVGAGHPTHLGVAANEASGDPKLLAISDGRRVGYEIKFIASPRITRSIRAAIDSLKLDRFAVAYPGERCLPRARIEPRRCGRDCPWDPWIGRSAHRDRCPSFGANDCPMRALSPHRAIAG